MKATELMIRDWVLHEGEPYQIRQLGIYGVDRDGEDYPAVCVGKPEGVGLIVERNEIEPIPLTPEILEKNGFGYKEEDSYYIHFYQGERCYIANSDLHIGTNKKGVFWLNYYNNSIHWLRYVHELQHAFRLCHVEKQIEL